MPLETQQPELRAFTLNFLDLFGAKVLQHDDQETVVELPPQLSPRFHGRRLVRLTFQPEVARDSEEHELIVPGGYALAEMVAAARERGACGRWCVALVGEPVDWETSQWRAALADKPADWETNLAFENCSARPVLQDRVLSPHLLILMKLSWHTDEVQERLVPVVVDCVGGKVISVGEELLWQPEAEPTTRWPVLDATVDPAAAFQLARSAVEDQVMAAAQEEQRGPWVRLLAEFDSLDAYYRDLERDTLSRRLLEPDVRRTERLREEQRNEAATLAAAYAQVGQEVASLLSPHTNEGSSTLASGQSRGTAPPQSREVLARFAELQRSESDKSRLEDPARSKTSAAFRRQALAEVQALLTPMDSEAESEAMSPESFLESFHQVAERMASNLAAEHARQEAALLQGVRPKRSGPLDEAESASLAEGLAAERSRLQEECQRRKEELADKFSLKILYAPVAAHWLEVPRLRQVMEVSNLRTTVHVPLYYDLLTRRPVVVACHSCRAELTHASLCTGRHLVCSSCQQRCEHCQLETCAACGLESCRTCGKRICAGCVATCPGCAQHVCADHLRLCVDTQSAVCPTCSEVCGSCQQVFSQAHLAPCPVCQKPTCLEDLDECPRCHKRACALDRSTCPICSEGMCTAEARACSSCGQANCCESCVDETGICATCRSLLPTIETVPHLTRLITESGLGKELRWLRHWQLAENSQSFVVVGRGLFRRRVFVVDKSSLRAHLGGQAPR